MTIQKRKRRAREYSRRAARYRRGRHILIGVTVLWAIVLVIACIKIGLSWDKPDADMPEPACASAVARPEVEITELPDEA